MHIITVNTTVRVVNARPQSFGRFGILEPLDRECFLFVGLAQAATSCRGWTSGCTAWTSRARTRARHSMPAGPCAPVRSSALPTSTATLRHALPAPRALPPVSLAQVEVWHEKSLTERADARAQEAMTTAQRRTELARYLFRCECELCASPAPALAAPAGAGTSRAGAGAAATDAAAARKGEGGKKGGKKKKKKKR